MFTFRQGNQLVTAYFTGLKAMLDELEVLIPVPKCTCDVNCTCDTLGKVKEQRNILCVTRFVKGLNEQFSAAGSQIMLMTPLPSLNHAFGMVVQ